MAQVFTAVDHLAADPRPEGAFGSTDVLRIHVGATGCCTRSATGRSAST
ncbi:hypothetical protein [Streptomyces sp. Ac-502]